MRGVLLMNESMAAHNSWRAGGEARRYYRPADAEDLCDFLATAPGDEPLLWCGLGSNLLVRDGGWSGTVIATLNGLDRLHWMDARTVRVEAGVPCNKLARAAAKKGLVGAEFLAGIPGTMGGALAMNAGAWGGETWTHAVTVETADRHGRRRERAVEEFRIGYRDVQGLDGEWFLSGVFQFQPGDAKAAQSRIRHLLAERAEKQPTGLPSCGSVFRNPPGDHAARLIEACGLKGYRMGGARVSPKHANFIINEHQATAGDIEALLRHIQATVHVTFGIALEPEVRIEGRA